MLSLVTEPGLLTRPFIARSSIRELSEKLYALMPLRGMTTRELAVSINLKPEDVYQIGFRRNRALVSVNSTTCRLGTLSTWPTKQEC